MAQRFCSKCGAANLDTAQFCGGCGGPMAAAAPPPPPAAPAYVPPPSPPQPVYAPPPAAAYPPPPTPGYAPAPAYAPPPGAGYPAPASKTPMIVVALLVLGGGGFAAWWFFFRAAGPGKTPEATYEAVKKCILNDDFASIYDLVAPQQRKVIDDQLSMMKKAVAENPAIKNDPNCPPNIETMDVRAFLTWASTKMPAGDKAKLKQEAQTSVIEKVDINGDTATVRVKNATGSETVMMTRIDGKWYLSQMPD